MSLTYLGSATVGDWVPAGLTMQAALLADLQAKLAAQLELVLQLNISPFRFTIQGSLDITLQLVAEIQAQISLGIELPSIQIQLDAAFAFIAVLQIQIDLLLKLQAAFGTAGVHGYAYSGPTNALGSA